MPIKLTYDPAALRAVCFLLFRLCIVVVIQIGVFGVRLVSKHDVAIDGEYVLGNLKTF